ncbi:MAG: hypothetical protein ABI564_10985 [Ideonella sp.]
MKTLSCLASLLMFGAASAAVSDTEEFPQNATSPTAQELTTRLAGKSFAVQLKDGMGWKLEYNSSGYFFVDTSTGGRAKGIWHAEDGKLCSQVKGRDTTVGCNEARVHDDQIVLRRTNGELIRFVAR